jgi:hypothetical protein
MRTSENNGSTVSTVKDVGYPQVEFDAANKGYVDTYFVAKVNITNDVADPVAAFDVVTLNFLTNNGGAPLYTDGYNTTTSTIGTIRTIAIPSDTFVEIQWIFMSRDTGNNDYYKKSITTWKNVSGTATQVGIEQGPAAVDQITATGASITASSGNVLIRFGGHASTHTAGILKTWVLSTSLPAAT